MWHEGRIDCFNEVSEEPNYSCLPAEDTQLPQVMPLARCRLENASIFAVRKPRFRDIRRWQRGMNTKTAVAITRRSTNMPLSYRILYAFRRAKYGLTVANTDFCEDQIRVLGNHNYRALSQYILNVAQSI